MNPWLMPEPTGDDVTDVANALTNRYGGSSRDIFNGLGGEMGLAQSGVPTVSKSIYMPGDSNNVGEFNPLTGKIFLDPSSGSDASKMAMAHELSHAADMYSAPYPLRSNSHLYFDNQYMPYLNQELRKNAAEERKNNQSQKLPNPWSNFK